MRLLNVNIKVMCCPFLSSDLCPWCGFIQGETHAPPGEACHPTITLSHILHCQLSLSCSHSHPTDTTSFVTWPLPKFLLCFLSVIAPFSQFFCIRGRTNVSDFSQFARKFEICHFCFRPGERFVLKTWWFPNYISSPEACGRSNTHCSYLCLESSLRYPAFKAPLIIV